MFQKQISMSYPTKTEIHGEIIRIVQHLEKNLFLNLRIILVDAEKAIINIQH